ncbi:MAG TPA: 8-oxo-dGTP diphosphatase [Chloroflexia bacterium]|nr:8-oxo-dGTP diphosphatase [Chloroflexia bacterium]
MAYTPIVGTLGYIMSEDGKQVLLIHRNARADDQHLGKYNGLGGKLETNEDVADCMRRELREEAAIEVEEMVLRGTVSWPGFGKQGEDWLGFIFRIDRWSGTPLTANHEGVLEWVPLERLLSLELPLWEGDRFFLPLVFSTDPRQFHGIMPYEDGHPVSWSYSLV